ncbi:hypothetical protein QTL95_07385 [Rhizobium sp. S152]|uniref:hypothetical protein n=1 Tax=Rhizobium sp. S152 TaxID=3055038 RepID=UPI0025A961D1|nr:hypothetical protein [Rhizobium sp. S152]MDM9625712.1 hypothetical protein [Rhizobium sp. S152]
MPTPSRQTQDSQQHKMDELVRKARSAGFDTRDPEFRKRIAEQVAALDPEDEADAMRWIEAVSIFNDEEWTEQE